MDKRIKELWITALRSGEYKQTKKCLKDFNGYCCLGVLTDIFHKETGKGEWQENGQYKVSDKEFSAGALTESVMNWSMLFNMNPDVENTTNIRTVTNKISLAELNDNGCSFNEIADIIEKQL